MSVIEKKLSPFIEQQFPSFYRDYGPVFVEFVKEYYRWLESRTLAANEEQVGSWVSVSSQNNVVLGTNTSFSELISNGDTIAIWRNDDLYDIYTVNSVANNTLLTITSVPDFSNSKTSWATTETRRNFMYDSRRFLEYIDIDATIDEFIIHFKEKYLVGIQFDTQSNIRQLLKHTLDLYRAKGTPQALELLFRIVFGTNIDIYYPSTDIFRLSDGSWKIPRYIEISLSEVSPQLVNKQIIGIDSGAKAFVERAVRRNINNRLTDILYVSSIFGEFRTGERIDLDGTTTLIPELRPTIVGSLTEVVLAANGSGSGFAVGDVVSINSFSGSGAQGRVTQIANNTGAIAYTLADDGYGYEVGANTEILISESVLFLSNVAADKVLNPWVSQYITQFGQVVQPKAFIEYVSANGPFLALDNVYTYHANGDLKGIGRVMVANTINSTSGNLYVAILSGNLEADEIYTTGNAVGANVSVLGGYTEYTSSANVIMQNSNVTIIAANTSNDVSNNDVVMQFDTTDSVCAKGRVLRAATFGSNTHLVVNNYMGLFDIGKPIYKEGNVLVGNVADIQISVGVISLPNNAFTAANGNYTYFSGSNTSGNVYLISAGSGADVSFNIVSQSETVNVNTDYINGYLNVEIAATAYGFPKLPSGNLSSSIGNCLATSPVTIGKISALVNMNPGSGYTAEPMIVLRDKQIATYEKRDYLIEFTGAATVFRVDELVTQEATGARGQVRSANATHLILKRMRFNDVNDFVVSSNATTQIIGADSLTAADAVTVSLITSSIPSGLNANVATELTTADGSVVGIELIDTGFGFVHDENVDIAGNNASASGIAATGNGVGFSRGYYEKKGGFLSDQKKLHDGYYYQEYSYDVLSSVTLDKYKEMLREVAHVAGTKNFASLVTTSHLPTNVQFNPATVSIS